MCRNSKGQFMKGHKTNIGRTHTLKARKKMSISIKNAIIKRGYRYTSETINHLSKINTGKILSESTKYKISMKLMGIKRSEDFKRKHSKENNSQWMGGVSHDPYPKIWNEILKRLIRKRDNNLCQICYSNGKQVHHIDYNKNNCIEFNLITLCCKCHINTNHHREYWPKILSKKIRRIYETKN